MQRETELAERTQGLQGVWLGYRASPTFERFVQFAVTLNSFTEYLSDQGLRGLHHASHELEQVALALFGDESSHPVSDASLRDIDQRMSAIGRMVDACLQLAGQQDERRSEESDPASPLLRQVGQILALSNELANLQTIASQLGYFGIQVDVCLPANGLDRVSSAPVILFDLCGQPQSAWRDTVAGIRKAAPSALLIASGVRSEFFELQQALKCGCDHCFPDGTPLQTIVAKLLEFNDPAEVEPFRVLIVEDSMTATRMIERALQEQSVLTHAVSDPFRLVETVQEFRPDLLLMDMYMPNCTGVEATRVLRQYEHLLSLPIVYLSGETDVGLQVEALRLGGDHFLTKPFNPVFLNAIVKSKIERYRALRRSIHLDSLTGLLNHTAAKSALDGAIAIAERSGKPMSVVMIDIDHFKRVNDTYGHPVGDQIIRSLAWLLKQRLRRSDIIGRYGGEEFLIALPGVNAEQAFTIVDRIRQDFNRIRHPHSSGEFSQSFSGGIAHFPRLKTGDELVNAADEALYDSKHGGRNRLSISRQTPLLSPVI